MSDLTIKLLELIKEEKTVNEISKELNLSNKQIFNILTMIRNKGYEFDRKYYSNGDIIYVPKKYFLYGNKENSANIITDPSETTFKAMVISDTHIGSNSEQLDLLDKIYEYCIKNNIHIILHCGDFIDGTYGQSGQKHDSCSEQIDYALQKYPFDKNIINFLILGDHDNNALLREYQNLDIVLKSYRNDIVSLGYNDGKVNIKNDSIILHHPFLKYANTIQEKNNLILKGHSHRMGVYTNPNNNNTTISVPSLSGIFLSEDDFLPGAVLLELDFKNGYFVNGRFNQLLIDNKIHSINEFGINLSPGKYINSNTQIQLEEDRSKKLLLQKKNQIDKFNEKYKIK